MQSNIDKIEDYRLELKRAMDASQSRLARAVDRHIRQGNKPINIEDLDAFPLGVWKDLSKNISAKKRANRFGSLLSFDIKMNKDAEFSEHFHDDAIESTEVVEGEILDTSSGIVYKKGDVAHYDNGKKHTPVATKDTELHVLFKSLAL